jgi:two-component system chemotaxis response regulator CheB
LPRSHALIAIGASLGGVEPLRELVAGLPPELPASVLVALHMLPSQPSLLADVLRHSSRLPVAPARDLIPLELGYIYTASPDRHLSVEDGVMRVTFGPRENRHRPSIDTLFRSAAQTYRERAFGVLLSGQLDDGVAGLLAIKAWGGIAVVQDPQEALAPEMPRQALQRVPVDHCQPIREIAPLLARLARGDSQSAVPAQPAQPPERHRPAPRAEPAAASSPLRCQQQPSTYGCPTCGGVLWEVDEGLGWLRYRCRVGHAFSPQSLADEQQYTLEDSLWSALRSLEEIASLLLRLAEAEDAPPEAESLRQRAHVAQARAAHLRELLPRC